MRKMKLGDIGIHSVFEYNEKLYIKIGNACDKNNSLRMSYGSNFRTYTISDNSKVSVIKYIPIWESYL